MRLDEIGSFSSPVYITQPPGGGELFVVEQGGTIQRVGRGGGSSTFLDLRGRISSGGERGLLSMAFAPDYRRTGLFYVNFTDPDGHTRVVEFRSRDGRTAVGASRRDVLRIDQPFSNHNGGLIEFGPDGLLYIATGDGGSANDPQRTSQDLSSLLGKLLRIDPRGGDGRAYRIPGSNPFTGTSGARGEIYALGLRNPWRFSFDRRSGALSIGDVGQNSFEEVDLVGPDRGSGANFGWSAFEGDERFNGDQQAPDHTRPVLTYPTANGSCSVTGGYVVRDTELRSLYGRYLYGDFCSGDLRSFTARPGRKASDDRSLGLNVTNLSSFGEDRAGHIYAISLNGPVYRLRGE